MEETKKRGKYECKYQFIYNFFNKNVTHKNMSITYGPDGRGSMLNCKSLQTWTAHSSSTLPNKKNPIIWV